MILPEPPVEEVQPQAMVPGEVLMLAVTEGIGVDRGVTGFVGVALVETAADETEYALVPI